MNPSAAPLIHLKDYQAPAYTIAHVALDVALDPTTTQITSTVQFIRADNTAAHTPLVLDGDELTFISLLVDGKEPAQDTYTVTPKVLTLHTPPQDKEFTLQITTQLAPVENTKLMGLYQSQGIFCTQCEAEGFRHITYFLDRPDVLATYTVRLEADRDLCPILLSNGNPVEKGDLPQNRHFAVWHDPHPKPSYLFALVGGKLDTHHSQFTTASNRLVDLNIYVEEGKAPMAHYAMDALKRSMTWDEENYGCEYDLDVFNIVAVSDFNMGAMENKGLNIFNDKYVLADPELATDIDYENIEGIIAHEYFHNWTGNRITCRDWFQLCLKEGLTVYRDQEFSSDMRSRPVKRIDDVRILKASQFSEDAGPFAHPVRPAAYREINNFYTPTVYQKGAELVRMLAQLVGPQAYRQATDLYFERYDGTAAVVEDWLAVFEEVTGQDLSQFALWYAQAGTPTVKVTENYDADQQSYQLTFTQNIAPTPDQDNKKPVPIPVKFGLLDAQGNDLPIQSNSTAVRDDYIILKQSEETITFENIAEKPIASLLRGFSAPVVLKLEESNDARIFKARYDNDSYNRWAALNGYATALLVENTAQIQAQAKSALPVDQGFIQAMIETCFDTSLDPALRAQALSLPTLRNIALEIGQNIDPEAIYQSHQAMKLALGQALGNQGLALVDELTAQKQNGTMEEAAGLRALSNTLLPLLLKANVPQALERTVEQFNTANNMTDRFAALLSLTIGQDNTQIADRALDDFYQKYQNNSLVIDKWFSAQSMIPGQKGLQRVQELSKHPLFTYDNPNRVRALLAGFAANNLTAFHQQDGSAYSFYINHITVLDTSNPQIAASLLKLLNNWKSLESKRANKAKEALQAIQKIQTLSSDVQEIIDRSLA